MVINSYTLHKSENLNKIIPDSYVIIYADDK